jgi:glycosidase
MASRWQLTALIGALLGCTSEGPPQRDCLARVWVPASAASTTIVGSWDGWRRPGVTPAPHQGGWLLARLELAPGEYGYLLDDGTGGHIDAYNPLTTFEGDEEVSLLLVEDCSAPRIVVDGVSVDPAGTLSLDATFLTAASGAPLDGASVRATFGSGAELGVASTDPDSGRITLTAGGLGRGKHRIVLAASDDDGHPSAPATAIAWLAPRAELPEDQIIYQVMIDRFRAADGSPLRPPPTPGSRAGGTLGGVTDALLDGTFEALGVTTLWLSPVYLNPDGAHPGNDGRLYEGYHGYWPLDGRSVDPRLGGEAALEELVMRAHERGIAVVLDVVPNHVYQAHPRYQEHQGDGWFTPPGCVCGTASCPWAGNIESCWFTPYLPDLRFQLAGVMNEVVDETAFWVERFDLDGVRIDAVPMMPRAASRRIAQRLRSLQWPPRATFLLGEVFTGPGELGLHQLRYQLGPSGLDSVFDFPLMWALHAAVARSEGSFEDVEAMLALEDVELLGSGAVMARILDNHDTPRFVSVAEGDGHGDPWEAPALQPSDPEPYRRLGLALGVTFTLPGAPVVFQGDEIGLAGANDPDCRRVMPGDDELSAPQLELRARVQALGRLRACSPALRRGERIPLHVSPQAYAYARRLGESVVVVLVSTAAEPTTIDLAPGIVGVERYLDVVSGSVFSLGDSLSLPMDPLSLRILVAESDGCALAW